MHFGMVAAETLVPAFADDLAILDKDHDHGIGFDVAAAASASSDLHRCIRTKSAEDMSGSPATCSSCSPLRGLASPE